MNPKRSAPTPIIDNLEHIGDPFRSSHKVDVPECAVSITDTETDLRHALRFLASYDGSTATFNSYRRELERLLQWSWLIEEKSICSLQRDHIEAFIRFCLKPPIAWIGTKNVSRFKSVDGLRVANRDWRPFVITVSKSEHQDGEQADRSNYSASQASIKSTFTALSSFYGYLIQENAALNNPVGSIRQKNKYVRQVHTQAPVRRITAMQWDYVIETIEALAEVNPERYERSLFILNCLYAMYLRISELVADERSEPTMGDFRRDRDRNWWLHITGKGNKDRIVTVSDDMLASLQRYRKHLGLSPLPALNERTPLVAKTRGSGSITSTRQIRELVQECFDVALSRMKEDGLAEEAGELKSATVHWLRHTGISEDVKTRPREHVRDDAGHSSMQTTDRYIETDLRERHQSAKYKKMREL